ncbi:vegetative cell wall protein gp1-like [Schistocerca americana]|uniref:vegetative cell wall protein gp1-like n=1 Tax=Schistocerca americana TaxID=7009 RepID=UPI001F4FD7C5|nr:vegetative cell wall protein gp1-like [Schistocerca americana]
MWGHIPAAAEDIHVSASAFRHRGERIGVARIPLDVGGQCAAVIEELAEGVPRLPTSLPPPGQQQQQPSPLPRRQPVPLMPPAQLHPGAPLVVAPAPAVPLQSPPPSELMDVDPSAGPPSQAVAVQPVLQPLSLGTPKESDTAAPCPAPTQQPSTQRQETLPLFVGPDAPSRPVPEAAPVVTGRNPNFLSGLSKRDANAAKIRPTGRDTAAAPPDNQRRNQAEDVAWNRNQYETTRFSH